MRRTLIGVLAAATVAVATACTSTACTSTGQPGGTGSEPPFLRGSGTLRVLAGSELADLRPILDQARQATGVTVELTQIGTLDGIEKVATGAAVRDFDAIWFSSNRYLELHPGAASRIDVSTKVANSPVVLGLRAPVARE